MDRQDVIQKLATAGHFSVAHAEDLYDTVVPRPVIPYYIADYIEKVKSEGDYTVVGAVNEAPDGRVRDWLFLERVNTFAQAWVNGYIVEGEPKYTVRIKATKQYLCNDETGPNFSPGFRTDFRKRDLEELGFGWVFDCPGVEVKEVE